MTKEKEYTIVSSRMNGNNRFIVITEDTGEILDDCQGYGYETKHSAHKGYWYKTKGKTKIKKHKSDFAKYKKENPNVIKDIDDWLESLFKELSRGEYDMDWIFGKVEEKFNIKLPKYVKKEYTK